jgi:hypothetical protein
MVPNNLSISLNLVNIMSPPVFMGLVCLVHLMMQPVLFEIKFSYQKFCVNIFKLFFYIIRLSLLIIFY